jgi:uncharacterized membrane protein
MLENFLKKFQASQPKKKRLRIRFKRFKRLPFRAKLNRIGQKINNSKHKKQKIYLILGVSILLVKAYYVVYSLKQLKVENAILLKQLKKIKSRQEWPTVERTGIFVSILYLAFEVLQLYYYSNDSGYLELL